MKAAELRKLIGKKVEWHVTLDKHRGSIRNYSGILEQVRGRNVQIDGEWRWLPSLEGFKGSEGD